MNVLLPHPDGPTIATNSPSAIDSVRSSTANASWPSYASQTCRKSTNGAAAPSAARGAAVTRGPGYFGNTIRSAFDGR